MSRRLWRRTGAAVRVMLITGTPSPIPSRIGRVMNVRIVLQRLVFRRAGSHGIR